MKIKHLYGSATVFLLCYLTAAGGAPPGILGQQGPSWDVTRWYNLPEGQKNLDLKDLQGKVVYLYCFQSWCPGCHRYGFPTLRKLIDHYQGKNQDIEFIAVQTAFEGFSSNSETKAKQTADRYKLNIPVGHSGSATQRSALMTRYRTGGTPWAIVIDRTGKVRYNDFHITPDQAIVLIDKLLKEKGPVGVNQDSAKKPSANFNIKYHGVDPHYPVYDYQVPKLNRKISIFYIEKMGLSGTLNLIIFDSNLKNLQWNIKTDWLKYFNFAGLDHYSTPIKDPNHIPSSQLLLKWDDSVIIERSRNYIKCTANFTLKKRDGNNFKPGFYSFLKPSLTKDTPFLLNSFYYAWPFVVSHINTKFDHVNWHKSQGDKLFRIDWSKTIPDPTQERRKRIDSLAKAYDEYSKCLEYIPDDEVVILAIANILERRRLYSEAIEYYDRVIHLWSKNKGLAKVRTWRRLDIRRNSWEDFLRSVQLHRDRLADRIARPSGADK